MDVLIKLFTVLGAGAVNTAATGIAGAGGPPVALADDEGLRRNLDFTMAFDMAFKRHLS